jgi:hypothetical protein
MGNQGRGVHSYQDSRGMLSAESQRYSVGNCTEPGFPENYKLLELKV